MKSEWLSKKAMRHMAGFRAWMVKLVLCAMGTAACLPLLLLITGSFAGKGELLDWLGPLLYEEKGFISGKLMPDYPTFSHYGKLLFMTPQFFQLFWNSIRMTALILIGQLLIGVPAAWAFAVYSFRFREGLFSFYVVLMLMPFQVTMLSQYLVLDGLGLMNTQAAVVLPAVFSAFPVFLAYRGFRGIPGELLDAARMDGAGERRIFFRLGLPLGRGGIMSAVVLGFLESYNMMEQPLAFLRDKSLWPLSLYLPEISWLQAGYAMAASLLTVIPAVFVFLAGQEELEQGIVFTGLKE